MPGELVMSMDERSPLNTKFAPYYKDQYTPFKYIIDERRTNTQAVYKKRNTTFEITTTGKVKKFKRDSSDSDLENNVALRIIKNQFK